MASSEFVLYDKYLIFSFFRMKILFFVTITVYSYAVLNLKDEVGVINIYFMQEILHNARYSLDKFSITIVHVVAGVIFSPLHRK